MSNRAAGEQTAVQSVDRAVTVLEILARLGEAGVTEIAGELEVHKSTAFRLISALEGRGLVERVEGRGRYRLGFGIIRLAGATTARLDLVRVSRPVCERLAAEIGETVNVAVLRGDSVVNLDQARGDAAIVAHNWVGQTTPLHATSSGKVLLAHLGERQRKQLLGGRLAAFTEHTITSRTVLAGDLAEVLRRGWASTEQELELGLNAVAAPIRAHDRQVAGAISASGPSYRLTPDRLAETAELVVAGAAEIAERLGYLPLTTDR